jgi:hypothetical protein
MKDFSPAVLYAITREFLGGYFWLAVALALGFAGLAIIAFMRRREYPRPTLMWSVLAGLIGCGIAVIATPSMTNAGFDNFYGALDWLALAAIGAAAALALGLAVYGAIGTFMTRTQE